VEYEAGAPSVSFGLLISLRYCDKIFWRGEYNGVKLDKYIHWKLQDTEVTWTQQALTYVEHG